MLQPNRLNPPQSFRAPATPAPPQASAPKRSLFVSADDFDATGILAGCDPCASNYWWIPELHAPAPTDLAVANLAHHVTADHVAALQATRRTSAWPQAAA